nr:hypothetical protein BaRGS_032243 [Batillaria attramentaria]
MDTYPHLKQRMERIGVRVDKVVYRGYHASDQMQEMQNSAIESRTRLRLQGEMEEMQQNLTNLKLNKEEARAGLKKQMEAGRWQHKQRTEQMKQQHDLEQQQLQHTQRLELRSLDTAARLKREKEEDERKLDFLTRLSELDVNVTEKVNRSHGNQQITCQLEWINDYNVSITNNIACQRGFKCKVTPSADKDGGRIMCIASNSANNGYSARARVFVEFNGEWAGHSGRELRVRHPERKLQLKTAVSGHWRN